MRVIEVSVNNYAEVIGINYPGQEETCGRLFIIIFKYLKVSHVKGRLDLICGREWPVHTTTRRHASFFL